MAGKAYNWLKGQILAYNFNTDARNKAIAEANFKAKSDYLAKIEQAIALAMPSDTEIEAMADAAIDANVQDSADTLENDTVKDIVTMLYNFIGVVNLNGSIDLNALISKQQKGLDDLLDAIMGPNSKYNLFSKEQFDEYDLNKLGIEYEECTVSLKNRPCYNGTRPKNFYQFRPDGYYENRALFEAVRLRENIIDLQELADSHPGDYDVVWFANGIGYDSVHPVEYDPWEDQSYLTAMTDYVSDLNGVSAALSLGGTRLVFEEDYNDPKYDTLRELVPDLVAKMGVKTINGQKWYGAANTYIQVQENERNKYQDALVNVTFGGWPHQLDRVDFNMANNNAMWLETREQQELYGGVGNPNSLGYNDNQPGTFVNLRPLEDFKLEQLTSATDFTFTNKLHTESSQETKALVLAAVQIVVQVAVAIATQGMGSAVARAGIQAAASAITTAIISGDMKAAGKSAMFSFAMSYLFTTLGDAMKGVEKAAESVGTVAANGLAEEAAANVANVGTVIEEAAKQPSFTLSDLMDIINNVKGGLDLVKSTLASMQKDVTVTNNGEGMAPTREDMVTALKEKIDVDALRTSFAEQFKPEYEQSLRDNIPTFEDSGFQVMGVALEDMLDYGSLSSMEDGTDMYDVSLMYDNEAMYDPYGNIDRMFAM